MPPLQGIKVLLDEERIIRFTNWTLARLERDTGKTYLQHVRELEASGSHYSLISLTWGGLIHAEPRLTLEQVAGRIDLRNQEQIQALGKALGDSYKAVFGEETTEAPKAGADASSA